MALSNRLLTSISPATLATYPEAGELYRKLAQWVGVGADSLLLTPGSDGAIRLVFEAFVEHGDSVIHTTPTFAMYPVYSQMFGAQAIQIHYIPTETGPWLDVNEVISAVVKYEPKLVCLPNPDSPSGTTLSGGVLREILTACESVGAVLLLDEAYHPFHEWSAVAWTETSRNLIVARTFAKAWGVAGLRIGYAVGHPETIALLHKMRPMYEVSSIAVEFMAKMLDHTDEMMQAVARINAGKQYFHEEMEALGFKVLPTAGNFLHVAFKERGSAVHSELDGKVLYRAAFEHPSLVGYSRFSAAPKPIMEQVVKLIKRALERE
ncbi:MAG: histidinol-phosphate transaminase [Undibacterium sp.]|nr:histidinol-phosphate transaminase [Undibacterium sp.]